MKRKPMQYLVLFILLAFLSGCGSSSSQPEPEEAKEIPLSENESVTGAEDVLFSDAKKYFANGYYVLAKDTFRSIADTFPLGPYGEFSEIKLADAHFLQRDYGDAAVVYERIMKNRPASRNAAYLLMKAGRSYQLTNTDPMRDREPLEKAVTFYNEFLAKYPNSIFRQQVDEYLNEAQTAIADNERLVAEFYKKLGHDGAYTKRQKAYELTLARFGFGKNGEKPRTMIAKEGEPVQVARNQLEYSGDNLSEKIPTARPVLSDFEPIGSSSGETPRVVAAAWRESSSSMAKRSHQRDSSHHQESWGSSVRDISCSSKGGNRITIELLNEPGDEAGSVVLTPISAASQSSSKPSSEVRYQLPIELEEPFRLSCFNGEDLLISTRGELTLKTSQPFTVLTLPNPPRIILAEVR